MASYAKLVNGLEELNLPKIQENLGTYTEMVNQGDMSFTQALEELVSIECSYKKERLNHANIHKANFPFLKGRLRRRQYGRLPHGVLRQHSPQHHPLL